MLVKIIKCSYNSYWYANKIGDIIEVEDKLIDGSINGLYSVTGKLTFVEAVDVEKANEDEIFCRFIKERRKNMTWKTKLRLQYLSLKYRLQDWFDKDI